MGFRGFVLLAGMVCLMPTASADWVDKLLYPKPKQVPQEFLDRYVSEIVARAQKGDDEKQICFDWVREFKAAGYLSENPRAAEDVWTSEAVRDDCRQRVLRPAMDYRWAKQKAEQEEAWAKHEAEGEAQRAHQKLRDQEEARAAVAAAIPVALERLLSGRVDTASLACFDAITAISPRNNGGETIGACAGEVQTQYRDRLRTGQQAPKTCLQWAAAKGETWENASLGMQAGALDVVREPVAFLGEVLDAEAGTVLIFNSRASANSQIRTRADTTILGKRLLIGGKARGYGLQVKAVAATLLSGQKTKMPLIEAHCLEGL